MTDDALKGFLVLPVALSAQVEASSAPARFLYYRAWRTHRAKSASAAAAAAAASTAASASSPSSSTDARTLFVTNIPLAFDFDEVSTLFSCFGQVEAVLFDDLPEPPVGGLGSLRRRKDKADPSCRSARVVFAEREGAQAALAFHGRATRQPAVEREAGVPETPQSRAGLAKWLHEYKAVRPNPKRLQEQVDRFMMAFDERSEQEQRAAREGGPVVDEDGFTLVTSKKKKRKRVVADNATMSVSSRRNKDGTVRETAASKKRRRKKRKEKELINFYSFQRREKKMKELAVLRRKFEEDKKRVAELRAQRKFRPTL